MVANAGYSNSRRTGAWRKKLLFEVGYLLAGPQKEGCNRK